MPGDKVEELNVLTIEERIERLKKRAQEVCGSEMVSGFVDDCPPEVEEQFWKQVIAYHELEEAPLFGVLLKAGVTLPAPQQLDDQQLTVKLWEVIRALAMLGAFLEFTDHLSDRELYARLWNDILRGPTLLQPEDLDFACHIDLLGTGSEEDSALYLKYFADHGERRRWAVQFPEDEIPDHVDPPNDRDRHLPKAHEQLETRKQ